jgi:threonine dehydratase
MRHSIETEHLLVEGSAAVALAVVAEKRVAFNGSIVVVLCGANVSAESLRTVL